MIIIGVDPGISGALAFVKGSQAMVRDMPIRKSLHKDRRMKNEIDNRSLNATIKSVVSDRPAVLIIEDIHSFPGAKNSTFSQAALKAAQQAVITLCETTDNITVAEPVLPKTWQRMYGIRSGQVGGGTTKDQCLAAARNIFPHLANEWLARKKDNGRADALLIAHWYWQMHVRGTEKEAA